MLRSAQHPDILSGHMKDNDNNQKSNEQESSRQQAGGLDRRLEVHRVSSRKYDLLGAPDDESLTFVKAMCGRSGWFSPGVTQPFVTTDWDSLTTCPECLKMIHLRGPAPATAVHRTGRQSRALCGANLGLAGFRNALSDNATTCYDCLAIINRRRGLTHSAEVSGTLCGLDSSDSRCAPEDGLVTCPECLMMMGLSDIGRERDAAPTTTTPATSEGSASSVPPKPEPTPIVGTLLYWPATCPFKTCGAAFQSMWSGWKMSTGATNPVLTCRNGHQWEIDQAAAGDKEPVYGTEWYRAAVRNAQKSTFYRPDDAPLRPSAPEPPAPPESRLSNTALLLLSGVLLGLLLPSLLPNHRPDAHPEARR